MKRMKRSKNKTQRTHLGFGLGLRTDHYDAILNSNPKIDWFEIISENYMVDGGKPLYFLDQIRANYPMVMHGVSLSIGSTDPLDKNYLKQLKQLAKRVEPAWISDHLCWTGVHGKNTHDLLPLPYTPETVKHVASRIQQVQDYLGRQILIENVSSYVTYKQSEMTEWEFFSDIVKAADCLILLDLNNIYVSSFNHEFNPYDYLYHMPRERVYQFHLAGHLNETTHIIDTHDHPIIQSVWELYEKAVAHFGPVSTMIERDDNIPPLDELLMELNFAREVEKSVSDQCQKRAGTDHSVSVL